MRTVTINSIEGKFLTLKNNLPQVNYLCSLMQPEITIQRPFEITDIGYD